MQNFCRRDALRVFVCSASMSVVLKRASVALARVEEPADREVTFEWWVPAAQVDIVRENLEYQGQETTQADSRGVPVLVVFGGLALITYLAKAILALQRQIAYGGVVVDTRSEVVKITHDKALDAGVILIVSKDGTKIVERDETDLAKLIELMAKAIGK